MSSYLKAQFGKRRMSGGQVKNILALAKKLDADQGIIDTVRSANSVNDALVKLRSSGDDDSQYASSQYAKELEALAKARKRLEGLTKDEALAPDEALIKACTTMRTVLSRLIKKGKAEAA